MEIGNIYYKLNVTWGRLDQVPGSEGEDCGGRGGGLGNLAHGQYAGRQGLGDGVRVLVLGRRGE